MHAGCSQFFPQKNEIRQCQNQLGTGINSSGPRYRHGRAGGCPSWDSRSDELGDRLREHSMAPRRLSGGKRAPGKLERSPAKAPHSFSHLAHLGGTALGETFPGFSDPGTCRAVCSGARSRPTGLWPRALGPFLVRARFWVDGECAADRLASQALI